jgi:hypothetical protein
MRQILIILAASLLLFPAISLAQEPVEDDAPAEAAEAVEQEAAVAEPAEEAEAEPLGKAEQILQKVIEALGGEAYLNVQNLYREGRIYDFDHGQLASAGSRFRNYLAFPNKEWMEYGKKGKIAYLNNDAEGWELDKQGINDQTPEAIETWQEGNRRDFEYLFRFRVQEDSLPMYYLRKEYIDNRMAHIIEIVDTDNEGMKLYVDARTYLPMQLHYSRHSALRRGRVQVAEYYGKYVTVDGVQIPLHISRERDGQRVFEVFMSSVTLNKELKENFFTRENLEAHWEKVN